jgi:hypothetical protein
MSPSHDYKKQVVREYAEKYNCRTLVETGTYLGEMVEAMIPHFDRIISIELGEDLYWKAVQKFAAVPSVTLRLGDSGKLMPDVCRFLNTKDSVLFWLDGHYSEGITARGDKDCPVLDEMNAITQYHKAIGHGATWVILIDDARLFGENGWPTFNEVVQDRAGYSFYQSYPYHLEHDIIRIIL